MENIRVSEVVVMAVGGNALAPSGLGEISQQMERAREVAGHALSLLDGGRRLVIVHGNGPQVGALALAQEAVAREVPPQPLHVLGAMTQGQLGWLLSAAIGDALEAGGQDRSVAAIVTQVVVDEDDPGFSNPTKPIGPFFSAGRAKRLGEARGWDVAEDSGRGWRRVVASPVPIEVVEWPQIKALLQDKQIVIACGGGGIPMARSGDALHGVEAVIDKDLAAALVGDLVKAKTLLLLTGVEKVAVNFGTDTERALDTMTVSEARAFMADGQFPAGSMGPKVDAAIRFVEGGGREAIITSLDKTAEALAGTTGTRVTR
jgi:carbamate kinase